MTQNEQLTSNEQSEKRSRVSRFVSKIVALRKRGSVVYEDASLDEILDGPRPAQEETPVPAIELPKVAETTASGLPTRSLKPAIEVSTEKAFAPAGTDLEPIKAEPEAKQATGNVTYLQTTLAASRRMANESQRLAEVHDLAAKRLDKATHPLTRTIEVPSTDASPNADVAKSAADAFMEAKRARDAVFNADPLGAPKETVPFAEAETYNQMDKMVQEQHDQATQAHTTVGH